MSETADHGGVEWTREQHVARYCDTTLPNAPPVAHGHNDVLREIVNPDVRHILDLGCGDGRLLALCLDCAPNATGLGRDFSPPMLERARERFAGDDRVTFVTHDLREPLPSVGPCDLVVSGFAIHHLEDDQKYARYAEVFALLEPIGMFVNVEHVASPTDGLHRAFLDALGVGEGDPSNRCIAVETQLTWLREIGFTDVDCLWKWREMALLSGRKTAGA